MEGKGDFEETKPELDTDETKRTENETREEMDRKGDFEEAKPMLDWEEKLDSDETKRTENESRDESTSQLKKSCRDCGQYLELSKFKRDRTGKLGRVARCKTCAKLQDAKRKTNAALSLPSGRITAIFDELSLIPSVPEDFQLKQQCLGRCKKWLPLDQYASSKLTAFRRKSHCRLCISAENNERIEKKNTVVNWVGTKICSACKLELDKYDNFSADRGSADGIDSVCRACSSLRVWLMQEYIDSIRKNGACEQCGYKENWRALDFAHMQRSNKRKTRQGKAVGLNCGMSLENIKRELMKCRILCKVCHRIETKAENDKLHEDRKSTLHRNTINMLRQKEPLRAFVLKEKLLRMKCESCDLKVTEINAVAFDFDHIIPANKTNNISTMVGWRKSVEELQIEMAKCRLLCARCHFVKSIANHEMSSHGMGHVDF